MSNTDMMQEMFERHNSDDHAQCLKQPVHNAWRAGYITHCFILRGLTSMLGVRGTRGSVQTEALAEVMKSKKQGVLQELTETMSHSVTDKLDFLEIQHIPL